jgi:hypothetical protein
MKGAGLLNLPLCKELTLREADNGVASKIEELLMKTVAQRLY